VKFFSFFSNSLRDTSSPAAHYFIHSFTAANGRVLDWTVHFVRAWTPGHVKLRSLENACHTWAPWKCAHKALYKSTFTFTFTLLNYLLPDTVLSLRNVRPFHTLRAAQISFVSPWYTVLPGQLNVVLSVNYNNTAVICL